MITQNNHVKYQDVEKRQKNSLEKLSIKKKSSIWIS